MDTMIITYGVAAVAILAFVVSAITEVIKNVWPLKAVPTDAVVIVLSMIVTVIAYFGLIAHLGRVFLWYELALAIVGAFIVAYVAMFGWTKLGELWNRFKK